MKRQYAISILFQKDFKEDNELRQNFQLLLRHGTGEGVEMPEYEELKDLAINELIEKDETAKKFIKDGYSIFITTFCIIPLIKED